MTSAMRKQLLEIDRKRRSEAAVFGRSRQTPPSDLKVDVSGPVDLDKRLNEDADEPVRNTPDAASQVPEGPTIGAPTPDNTSLAKAFADGLVVRDPESSKIRTPTKEETRRRESQKALEAELGSQEDNPPFFQGVGNAVAGALEALPEQFFPMTPLHKKLGIPTAKDELRFLAGKPPDEVGGDRLSFKLGEDLTAGAVTAVPIFRLAKAGNAALMQRRFIGPIIQYAKDRPVAFIASEVGSATGSAALRTLASETPSGQLGGGVVGAFAPAAASSPTRLALRGFRWLRSTVDTAEKVRRATQLAKAELKRRKQTPDERLEAAVEEGERLAAEIPGFEPTTAQLLQDPGITRLETERAAAGGLTPEGEEIADVLNERIIGNREAVVRELGELGEVNRMETGANGPINHVLENQPPAGASAKEVFDAHVQAKAEHLAHAYEDEILAAQERIHRTVQEAMVGRSNDDFGEVMRDAIQEEARRVFDPIDTDYQNMDNFADEIGAEVDFKPIVESLNRLTKGATTMEGVGLPPKYAKRLERLLKVANENEGFIPFSELRGLVRETNDKLGRLKPTASRQTKRALRTLRNTASRILDSVDGGEAQDIQRGFMASAPDGSRVWVHMRTRAVEGAVGAVNTEMEALVKSFRSLNAQFNEAATRFYDGVNGKVVGRTGAPPAAAETMGLYFKPGARGAEAADSYLTAAADSPFLQDLMEDYIVTRAAGVLGDADSPANNVRALAQFKKTYADALNRFPGAKSKIDNIQELERNITEMGTLQKQGLADFEKSRAFMFMRKNPSVAVDDLMRSSNPVAAAREIAEELAGDPHAKAGFVRTFWERIHAKSVRYGSIGGQTSVYLEPARFAAIIDEYEPVLRALQGDAHVDRLRRLQRAAEISFVGRTSNRVSPEQRSAWEQAMRTMMLITVNKIHGVGTKSVRAFAVARRLQIHLDTGMANALLDEALVNPQVAKDLLRKMDDSAGAKAAVRRLRGHLLSLGFRLPEGETEEEVQDDRRRRQAASQNTVQ